METGLEKSEDERKRQLPIQGGFDGERIYTAGKLRFFFPTFTCDNSCELFNEWIYIFSNNLQFPSPLLLKLLLLADNTANLGALFM